MSAPKVKYAETADNGVPSGGAIGQVLKKKTATDNDTEWGDPEAAANGIPSGGTAGQVLKKQSAANYDADWANESGGGADTSGIIQEYIWGAPLLWSANPRQIPTRFNPRFNHSLVSAINSESHFSPVALPAGATLTAVSGIGFDHCYYLDGSNDYIGFAGTELLPYINDFCVVLWFKMGTQSGANRKILSNFSSGGTGGGSCIIQNAGASPYGQINVNTKLSDSNHYGVTSAKATYNDNAWHMVVFGRDISARTIYLDIDNGADTGSYTWASGLTEYQNAGPLCMGRDGVAQAYSYFTGYIGPVRFYDHMLYASEISALWNSGLGY